MARLREAALTYADAEDDDDFRKADDNLRKSADSFGRRAAITAIREGLQRAVDRGVRLGRPRASQREDHEIADVAKAIGVRKAARALGMSKDAVWRAIRRVAKK